MSTTPVTEISLSTVVEAVSRRRRYILVPTVLLTVLVSGCTSGVAWHAPAPVAKPVPVSTGVPESVIVRHGLLTGVYESGFPASMARLRLPNFSSISTNRPRVARTLRRSVSPP